MTKPEEKSSLSSTSADKGLELDSDSVSASTDNDDAKAETDEASSIATVPMPPMPPGSPVQVAMGMQLMMQRSSFDGLETKVQLEMIQLAGTLDERGFDYSCKVLEERSATRRWATVAICGIACLLVGVGTFFAFRLIEADRFDQAQTLIMTGVGVIGALLGGAGLQSVFKNIGNRS